MSAKRLLKYFIIPILIVVLTAPALLSAQESDYKPLAPLPGIDGGGGGISLESYISGIFTLIIGLAVVLSIFVIVVGGIIYITSDAYKNKNEGKTYITNAITGLVLAIASWVILYTINPALVEFNLNIQTPSAPNPIASEENVKYRLHWVEANYEVTLYDQEYLITYITDGGNHRKESFMTRQECLEELKTYRQLEVTVQNACNAALRLEEGELVEDISTKLMCENIALEHKREGGDTSDCRPVKDPNGDTINKVYDNISKCLNNSRKPLTGLMLDPSKTVCERIDISDSNNEPPVNEG